MSGPDPCLLSATAAQAELEIGSITSERLVSACLERIHQRSAVDAWAHLNADRALTSARLSDVKRKAGNPCGPLEGIPVGVKDIIDTFDFPTENGTPIFRGRRPSKDAFVVEQLRTAGAIILGKTVTTELAFFGPGGTRNPRNLEFTPGGSSSGSAAAVADYQVPLALGTQTAGSIIRPASYCGTIGFKPTFGYLSRTGILEQSSPLDTPGGYGRTCRDIALLIDAMSGFDAADPSMSRISRPPLLNDIDPPLARKPKIAFVKTSAWPHADPHSRQALETFANSFGANAEIVETALPNDFDGSLRLQQIIQFHDIALNYGLIADGNGADVSSKLVQVIAEGRSFSRADYVAALAAREPLYESLSQILTTYDAILTLPAPGPALKGLESTGSPMFNALWTYLGMPCISLPMLSVGGMPLGVQLTSARTSDGALLQLADWMMGYTPKS